MHKQDYELIAETIRNQYSVEAGEAKQGIYNLAQLMVYKFKEANPKFDREKFLTACGIGE